VFDYIGLEMRIIDLKEDHNGNLVWSEVNPQAQFIYLDGIVDLHVTAKFGEYLFAELSCLR
jgi:hypothetical protein